MHRINIFFYWEWLGHSVYKDSIIVDLLVFLRERSELKVYKQRMSVRWETEGLQTVGIVCLVFMFLKLMHLLGLIDITETGDRKTDRSLSALGLLIMCVLWKRNVEMTQFFSFLSFFTLFSPLSLTHIPLSLTGFLSSVCEDGEHKHGENRPSRFLSSLLLPLSCCRVVSCRGPVSVFLVSFGSCQSSSSALNLLSFAFETRREAYCLHFSILFLVIKHGTKSLGLFKVLQIFNISWVCFKSNHFFIVLLDNPKSVADLWNMKYINQLITSLYILSLIYYI